MINIAPAGCACPTCRPDGLDQFARAAHAVCDATEARDASAIYTAALALCVARARARAEQEALERAFDLSRAVEAGRG